MQTPPNPSPRPAASLGLPRPNLPLEGEGVFPVALPDKPYQAKKLNYKIKRPKPAGRFDLSYAKDLLRINNHFHAAIRRQASH